MPPTPSVAGIPTSGEPPRCALAWTAEDGRCWIISPSQADDGLGTPGICSQFDVSCDLDDLVVGDGARALFDGVIGLLDGG